VIDRDQIQEGQNHLFQSHLIVDGWISGRNGAEGKRIRSHGTEGSLQESMALRGLILIFVAYMEFTRLKACHYWS
jgi:hypothetical protein